MRRCESTLCIIAPGGWNTCNHSSLASQVVVALLLGKGNNSFVHSIQPAWHDEPVCCTGEAEAALVAAGQRFRAVAERDPGDGRALANWGRALCMRAELAPDAQVRAPWSQAGLPHPCGFGPNGAGELMHCDDGNYQTRNMGIGGQSW